MDREKLCEDVAREVWDEAEPTEGHVDAIRLALPMIVAAVTGELRKLHYPARRDALRTPICPDCKGKAGTHPCGCWASYDIYPVCGECGEQPTPYEDEDYPCPTARRLDQIDAEVGRTQDPEETQ